MGGGAKLSDGVFFEDEDDGLRFRHSKGRLLKRSRDTSLKKPRDTSRLKTQTEPGMEMGKKLRKRVRKRKRRPNYARGVKEESRSRVLKRSL